MTYKEFQELKNLRPVARDEVVLDCDDRQQGDTGIRRVCLMFALAGYNIKVYKAEGQKSYHAHMQGIPHIAELPKEQNKAYKEQLIKRYLQRVKQYVSAPEIEKIDFTLCIPDHLVAAEDKPHFKYNTIKKLVAVMNPDKENFCERDIYEGVTNVKTAERKIKLTSGITNKIIEKISIIDVARRYGIDVNSRSQAVCPFHIDSNPSLKFYDEQGRFVCFGCNVKGNIIDFIYLLRKNKIGEVKHG